MSASVDDEDDDLRDLLRTLSPSARDHLRDVLIRDQADRDAIASQLLRYRDERGTAWAELVDQLSLCPNLRRKYVRVLEVRPGARGVGSVVVNEGSALS